MKSEGNFTIHSTNNHKNHQDHKNKGKSKKLSQPSGT